MSETMSSPSNDWANFYQRNQSGTNHHQPALFNDNPPSAGATTVTSTNSSSSTNLNPEGRVSKPIRRRSRASRRTPTTLLNTDTANFRAMVQQFTGGPAASFPSGASSGLYPSGTNFSFGLGAAAGQQLVNNNSINAVMPPRGGGYNILQVQQPQQQLFQQQQQYMFSMNNNNNNNTSSSNHGDHSAFLDMLQSSRVLAPTMEGTTSSYVPPIRPSSSNKKANDRG